MSERAPKAVVDWGWAGRGLERQSGDLHAVVPFPGGTLIGLVDGLGHGPEAEAAAVMAVSVLHQHAAESLETLLSRCHDALRKTRGAVINLASFSSHDRSMCWIGVGNIEGVLLRRSRVRSHEALVARGGVVGYTFPAVRGHQLSVDPGDTLIFSTDGIRSGFTTDLVTEHPPQEIAESILARFSTGTDDAHVVVARYLGGEG